MIKQLKLGDIRSNFSNSYFNRGRGYFNTGRVLSVTISVESEHKVELRTKTLGSGSSPYKQVIEIEWILGQVDIFGTCSCPLGHNCKHVVAACLQYQLEYAMPQRGKVSTDSCMNWLDEFIESGSQKEIRTSGDFLLYLLKPATRPGELTVELLITRQLKRGGFAKGRSASPGQLMNDYYRPEYVQEADMEVACLLEACPKMSWAAPLLFEGEIGFAAIKKMIETGRCHWLNRTAPALQFGENRTFHIEWLRDQEDNARLKYSVTNGGEPVITTPALYIDKTDNVMGLLNNADYSVKQFKKLLSPVNVPASHLSRFSQKLMLTLPNTVPPPEEVKTTKIKQPPQPRIRLTVMPGLVRDAHRIELDFLYADYAVPARPFNEVENLTNKSAFVQIWRDYEKEQAAIERMTALGFSAMTDESGQKLLFLSMDVDNHLNGLLRWQNFMENTLPQLVGEGWEIERDEEFKLTFHHSDEWHAEVDGDSDWFDLRFDIEVNGEKRPLLPLITTALTHYDPQQLPDLLTIPLENNEYLVVPSEKIRPIIDILYELYNSESLNSDGSLRMSRFDAGRIDELEQQSNSESQWQGGEALRELGKKLNNFDGIQPAEPPAGLMVELREYQQQGLNWLQFLREYQFGGILADDMGLGKTVQTLAHLLLEKEQGRMNAPCLVIAPTSLMSNWQREAANFAPALKVLILQGADRHQNFDNITQYDLILSTYPLLVRDETVLLKHTFHYLVLDEAQIIKNPKSKAAQVIRRIHCNHRLCLTGTPMENHLGELWALFDFLLPGLLGDSRQFKQLFRTPIEKNQDYQQQQRLGKRIAPFMLRRTKGEVASELPEKSEIIRSVSLEGKQAALYESIRISMEKKVRDAIASKGLARSHITILDALLKLRQCCCDPQLLKLKQAQAVKSSAKLDLLMTLLPEMVEEGRRILLFSSFTQMLGIIEQQLIKHSISYSKLTGQTRKRDEAIEYFKSGQADVFLISLKAGGVGLNLTEADTVIHYDPWWNPAAENQATDRAHRIGQEKAVFVYKLITENTLEEKILAMQAKKQALIDGVYKKGAGKDQAKLSSDDLKALFSPLAKA
ncbi:DNA/RNA helicases, SNF2 family [hydrothermal vent metagenome]|uniref:DNA/RNA helicases, SNF2 family n=1 Tax=hydrothermal vent metagenome TaxID=652676 RepID=A0A3B0Z9I4_9ZZZZ